jgi:predicted acyl esterase
VCRFYIIGANHSEGILQYGGYAESLAAASMVDWLNGRVKAYSDPTGTIEVKAYWATGDVAMGGTSYNGTLPMADGVTGVEGLKTIIPIAPVTSAYDYYLANSMFYAPGGYLGEEITNIIVYCFGRGFAGSGTTPSGRMFPSSSTWNHFWNYLKYNLYEQDTDQGDYSPYYDERNIVSFGDDMRKDLGVIMLHGFNDNNVRFKQTGLYNEMLKYYGIEVVRGSFSRFNHTDSGVNSDGAKIAENMHEWIDHYLYGIDNGVVDKLPNYSVQSSSNSTWKYYDEWPAGKYRNFYPTGNRVGGMSRTPQANTTSLNFKDVFQLGLTRPNQPAPTGPAFVPNFAENAAIHAGQGTVMASSQFLRWKNYITGGNDSTLSWSGGGVNMIAPTGVTANWTKELHDRLLFIMDVPEEMTISGVIKMTAEVAANKNYGALSAMVLDIGSAARTTTATTTTGARSITLANGSTRQLHFNSTSTGPLAIVSRGSVDIRNPNPDGKIWPEVPGMDYATTYGGNWNPNYLYQTIEIKPGEFHSYTWELDVQEYTIRKGHRLAVILYGSDPEYTYLPLTANDVTEFTVNVGSGTYLSLPIVGHTVSISAGLGGAVVKGKSDRYETDEFIEIEAEADYGYRFVNWTSTAGEFIDADSAATTFKVPLGGATVKANFERIPITSIRINSAASIAVKRGETLDFGVILNAGAIDIDIVWTVNNALYASVGEGGIVTILNRIGTAVLTATDPASGMSYSIVLRIT